MNLQDYITYKSNTPEYIKYVSLFLFDTGIRPAELFLISKSNLSYIDGKINYTQPKTNITRRIKLSRNVLRLARYWRKERGNFAKNFRNYKDLKRQLTHFIIFNYPVKDGHKKLYNFRYLYVLEKIKRNIPEVKISELLGHNDRATVADYIKHALNIEEQKQKRSTKNGKA